MIRLRLHQFCTYWEQTGINTFGQPTWASPIELACRWEDKMQEVSDGKGDKVMSSAVIWVSQVIKPMGILMLGKLAVVTATSGFNSANILANQGAHEILTVGRIPNLQATQFLTEVTVK